MKLKSLHIEPSQFLSSFAIYLKNINNSKNISEVPRSGSFYG